MRLLHPERPGVAIEVQPLTGLFRRMRGLLRESQPNHGWGVLLRGKQVHTFGMKFSIDAVYLSRDGEVLEIMTLEPGRMGPFVRGAREVLEMRAGEAGRLGLRPGLRLLSGD